MLLALLGEGDVSRVHDGHAVAVFEDLVEIETHHHRAGSLFTKIPYLAVEVAGGLDVQTSRRLKGEDQFGVHEKNPPCDEPLLVPSG